MDATAQIKALEQKLLDYDYKMHRLMEEERFENSCMHNVCENKTRRLDDKFFRTMDALAKLKGTNKQG
jgi:hypothetical protein